MTISTYIGIKGLLLSILGQVRLSFCKKTLGIDGTACQTLGAIAGTPWAVKGMFGSALEVTCNMLIYFVAGAIGVISDMYPLFGWHKASYINVVGVLGAIAFLALAALPITTAHAAGFLLLLGNLQVPNLPSHASRNKAVPEALLSAPRAASAADCDDGPAHGGPVRRQDGGQAPDRLHDGAPPCRLSIC